MLALTLLLGCPANDAPTAAPLSRVDAAAPPKKKAVDTEAFCDSRGGSSFTAPVTEGAPMVDEPTWTWVNVWATWCKPCIAEMPMIVGWKDKLAAAGQQVAIQFLSVDAKAEDLAAWQAKNPQLSATTRLADFTLLAPWLGTVGLDASAALPIHLFVDPENKVRCVRMGGLAETDYAAVEAVVAGK